MVLVRNAMVVKIIILIALSVENNHFKAEPAGDDVALHSGSSGVDRASLAIVVKRLLESLGDEPMAFGNAMRLLQLLQERRITL